MPASFAISGYIGLMPNPLFGVGAVSKGINLIFGPVDASGASQSSQESKSVSWNSISSSKNSSSSGTGIAGFNGFCC